MKVLLVKPYGLSDHIQPSLGLGYLAAAIKDKHSVEILDCIKQGLDCDALCKYVEDVKPDVVGIQTYSYDIDFVKRASKAIKTVNDKVMLVIGGPHPSCVPRTIFETFPDIDFGFAGEAEIGFSEFLAGKNLSQVPGLIYRVDGKTTCNPPKFLENLDEISRPAWEMIKPETYPEAQHGFFFQKFPIAPIMVTRGCPFNCTFCAGNLISGRKVRRRSIANVLKEILYLYNERGIREFHIVDDNFTMDKGYTRNFLLELKKLNLDISWATPNGVRMDTLDKEILALMKETGLYLISLGIESGSDRILSLMQKGITLQDIEKYVSLIGSSGIDIAGFFILGFPTETEEEIRKTIDLAVSLPIIRANFFTYLPFPGTDSYKELEENGELSNVDWENFYFMKAAYVPKSLSRKQLKYLQRLAFLRFFLRPKIFFKTISGIKSPKHFLFFVKRFYHWIIM